MAAVRNNVLIEIDRLGQSIQTLPLRIRRFLDSRLDRENSVASSVSWLDSDDLYSRASDPNGPSFNDEDSNVSDANSSGVDSNEGGPDNMDSDGVNSIDLDFDSISSSDPAYLPDRTSLQISGMNRWVRPVEQLAAHFAGSLTLKDVRQKVVGLSTLLENTQMSLLQSESTITNQSQKYDVLLSDFHQATDQKNNLEKLLTDRDIQSQTLSKLLSGEVENNEIQLELNADYRSQIKGLTETFVKLSVVIKDSTARERGLETMLEGCKIKLQTANDNAKLVEDVKNSEILEVEATLQQERALKDDLQEELIVRDQHLQEAQSSFKHLEDYKTAIIVELETEMAKVCNEKQRWENRATEHRFNSKVSAKEIQRLRESEKNDKAQITDLELALEEAIAEKDSCKRRLSQAEASWAVERIDLQTECESLQARLARLDEIKERQIAAAEAGRQHAIQVRDQVQMECEALRARLATKNDDLNNHREGVDHQRRVVADAKGIHISQLCAGTLRNGRICMYRNRSPWGHCGHHGG